MSARRCSGRKLPQGGCPCPDCIRAERVFTALVRKAYEIAERGAIGVLMVDLIAHVGLEEALANGKQRFLRTVPLAQLARELLAHRRIEPEPGTVEVKIAVVVDRTGTWAASGATDGEGISVHGAEADAMEALSRGLGGIWGPTCTYTVTATLPIPVEPEPVIVEGEVQDA